jgi:sulfate/thiosulfate transport system ATP-binding protein
MGFLGPTTEVAGVRYRPHDIEVFTHPGVAGSLPARIVRELRVGFEVRLTVELLDADHEEITVTVTRAHQRSLGLRPDVDVWLAPTHGAVVPTMPAQARSSAAGALAGSAFAVHGDGARVG